MEAIPYRANLGVAFVNTALGFATTAVGLGLNSDKNYV